MNLNIIHIPQRTYRLYVVVYIIGLISIGMGIGRFNDGLKYAELFILIGLFALYKTGRIIHGTKIRIG